MTTPPLASDSEAKSAAQQELSHVLSHLEATLSVRGLQMFERLYVRSQTTEEIVAETGLTVDAVYQWRSRLARAAREALAAGATPARVSEVSAPRKARRVP